MFPALKRSYIVGKRLPLIPILFFLSAKKTYIPYFMSISNQARL